MGTIYDDLDGHEGYAARRLPDGTLAGSWTATTASFSAYVPKCECGWRGTDHAQTEEGYEEAMDEWDGLHAQPLLAKAVPLEVRERVHDAEQSLNELSKERPLAALEALRDLAGWTQIVIVRLDAVDRSLRQSVSRDDHSRRLRL